MGTAQDQAKPSRTWLRGVHGWAMELETTPTSYSSTRAGTDSPGWKLKWGPGPRAGGETPGVLERDYQAFSVPSRPPPKMPQHRCY